MMNRKHKTTRSSVYETNSSSTHSVTICPDAKCDQKLPINKNGEVIINSGKYGWEYEIFKSPVDKASYALTYAINNKIHLLPMLKEVIAKEMGTSEDKVLFSSEDTSIPYKESCDADKWSSIEWGYIDHQSLDEASRIFETADTLRQFIFCSSSIFITDNDN